MEQPTKKTKSTLRRFAMYFLIALAIMAVFCAIIGTAYHLLQNEFTKAITLQAGALPVSVFPAYGQLGDAFGGMLNPFFGFITVCLLIWSIQVQLSELALTRDEVKKSADAMEEQVRVNKIEFERKQLEAAAEYYLHSIEQGLNKQIDALPRADFRTSVRTFSLNEALYDIRYSAKGNAKDKLEMLQEYHNAGPFLKAKPFIEIGASVQPSLGRLVACMETLGNEFITSPVLAAYWAQRAKSVVTDFRLLELIDKEMASKYTRIIDESLIKPKSTSKKSKADGEDGECNVV